jgi:predicted phosphodiesterase
VVDRSLLDALVRRKPTFSVLGNNDLELVGVLPPVVEIELGGVPIAMVHDSGPTSGRAARLHRRFPQAAIVIYGHSHQPDDSVGIDDQVLFNPGSPTERRHAPWRSYGRLRVRDGRIEARDIVEL